MSAKPQFKYGVLPEQAQEDALHATRLLSVEERLFARITKSLLSKDSPLRWTAAKQLPSPPPDGDGNGDSDLPTNNADHEANTAAAAHRNKLSEDIILDFDAFQNGLIRLQLTTDSNRRERERYTAEKAKVLNTAQAVRDNTIELRAQLTEAQHILEMRKGFDDLAKKLIPDDEKLKPRETYMQDIERLEKEIEDLAHESQGFESTWVARREAFDRVVEEGQVMVRLIKGIKDEPEPENEKEDGDGDGDGEADGDEVGTNKGEASHMGTPLPEAGETPRPENERDHHGLSSHVGKFLEVNDAIVPGIEAPTPEQSMGIVQADVVMENYEGDMEVADQVAASAEDVGDMDET